MNKFIFLSFLFCVNISYAQNFNKYFENKTLRIDYTFAGNDKVQNIYLDELIELPQWAGRRNNLSKLALEGNGDITMTDIASGDTIYRNSFSSLFQEWIVEDEAKEVSKSFENSFLLPFPKNESLVTIELKNNYNKVTSKLTHKINPKDILIRKIDNDNNIPYKYIQKSGSYENCIDIAILAEGYTEKEMDIFYNDAKIACDALFNHEPFKTYKNRFNVVAIAAPSKDSGVSIPGKHLWKETAVSSNFNTFYSDRYLTSNKVKKIHNLLAGVPYEHIIILANTDNYGGGGIFNSYTLTTAHHSMFKPVVVHEFGHSFGGLADEYAYDTEESSVYPFTVEPWEQNITTLVDFDSKWKDMIKKGVKTPTPLSKDAKDIYTKVGLFEGAGYSKKGIYRPTQECRMKINEAPGFCPVCQRALKRMIEFYTE